MFKVNNSSGSILQNAKFVFIVAPKYEKAIATIFNYYGFLCIKGYLLLELFI